MRYPRKTERVPDDWDAEQAYAVYEFLRELTECIWQRYGGDIVDSIRPHAPLDHRKTNSEPVIAIHRRHDDSDIPF